MIGRTKPSGSSAAAGFVNKAVPGVTLFPDDLKGTETKGGIADRGIITYIVLCQQIGAELQVVIEVERPTGFESGSEGRHSGSFGEFPHALDPPELTLSILLVHFRAPTGTAVVVI